MTQTYRSSKEEVHTGRRARETFSGGGGIGVELEGMLQDLAARRKKLMTQMGRMA